MLDKLLRIGQLYDYYGGLLTEKQRRCMEMHYLHDLSLAEIAEEFRVSRQAVHDILRRGEQILTEYEAKLGLAKRSSQDRETVQKSYQLLSSLPPDIQQLKEFKLALKLLKELINREKEV